MDTLSVAAVIKKAEQHANVAFTIADAAKAAIKHTHVTASSSLGQLIFAAANNAGVDANKRTTEITSRLKQDVKAAVSMLDDAQTEAQKLADVADFIEKGGRLDLDDFALIAQATAVREAHLMGLIDARSVATDIRRYISQGVDELEQAKKKWAKQTISASNVAAERIKLDVMEQQGADTRWQKMRVERVLGVHRWNFGSDPSHVHARERRLATKAAKRMAIKLAQGVNAK